MRSWLAALATLGVLVVGFPIAAAADPARPGNYRSEVTGVEPEIEGVRFAVVGGDSFLVAEVEPGVSVEVPGYDGEPYLRVDEEGGVWVNLRSPSYWINEDRFGRVAIPPEADAAAEPNWARIGGSGRVGWHDHRIHWMAPEPPPGIDRSRPGLISQWPPIPVRVDSTEVIVRGTLDWVPSRSPVPDLTLAGLVASFGWRRREMPRMIGLVLAGAALGAAVIGWAQMLVSPLGWAGELLAWAPPTAAVVLSLLASLRARSDRYRLLAVALLVGWATTRLPTLWMPVLPSPLPGGIERAAFAVALGGAGAVVLATWRRATDLNGGTAEMAGR